MRIIWGSEQKYKRRILRKSTKIQMCRLCDFQEIRNKFKDLRYCLSIIFMVRWIQHTGN